VAALQPDTPTWYLALRRAALAWYGRHARDLPWRRLSDPYAIWVSEVMLQQTQAATVEGYFPRFMARFPRLADLAAASEREVLRAWEGLGYYRRARELWRAARHVVEHYGGEIPRTRELLEQLPGVGPYTAGAILSIAFDQREPILEANTRRLWARLLDWRQPLHGRHSQQRLWRAARCILPRREAGRLNQALMELGSRVCTPRSPRCHECPLARWCAAYQQGSVHLVPRQRARPPTQRVRHAAAIVWNRGRVLLVQNPANGRWPGLWDFPRAVVHDGTEPRQQLRQELRRRFGVAVHAGPLLLRMTHMVTRYRIALDCFLLLHRRGTLGRKGGERARWIAVGELETYPLSATGRRIARHVARQMAHDAALPLS